MVAGHRGLVGSAITRRLKKDGYTRLVQRTHAELDLTNQQAVSDFFEMEKLEYVFLAAAKVGGIFANCTYPADFIYQNLAIQTNVIHQSWKHGVKRLLFLGSSCIYPRDCPQPIKEKYLLTGPLEETNKAYALAKIAGLEMCAAYNQQHGTQFLCAMPTNLYGPGDNYNLNNAHVLPALLRKMHEAKVAGSSEVVLWGSGAPKREFLFVDDLANALVFLATLKQERYDTLIAASARPLINVGSGTDQTVLDLSRMIADVVGYKGKFIHDTTKPDGTTRKVLDVSKMQGLGWKASTSLEEGIKLTYEAYAKAQP